MLGIGAGFGYLLVKPNIIFHAQVKESKTAKSESVRPVLAMKQKRTVKITPVSNEASLVPPADEIKLMSLRGGRKADEAILSSEIALVASPDRPSGTGRPSGHPPLKQLVLPRNDVTNKPRIVFVIDDLGYNKRQAEFLFSISHPLTLAILPQLPYSKYFSEEGKKYGFEIILHQPLEPESKIQDPGPGLIKTDMTVEQIQRILEENLLTVPDAIGINNHMGSHATRDRRVMYIIAKELKEKKLLFLDSMTHPQSVAHRVTFALGIPTLKRNVFLDNEDKYDSILERIKETAQIATEKGQAVAIGHIRKNTLQAIKDSIPKLEAEGYEIVSLGKLLNMTPRLSPPPQGGRMTMKKEIPSPLTGEG